MPNCLRLLVHWARRAASRAAWTAGRSRAINTPMMAITTKSSISVNPGRRGRTADFGLIAVTPLDERERSGRRLAATRRGGTGPGRGPVVELEVEVVRLGLDGGGQVRGILLQVLRMDLGLDPLGGGAGQPRLDPDAVVAGGRPLAR